MWPLTQYSQPDDTLADALTRLEQHIGRLPSQLQVLPVDSLQFRPPGKWSKAEIIGHLVDSALNNLKRFTEAQFSPLPYPIQPYSQTDLVRANQYGQMPVNDLTALWQALNRQILWVARAIPAEILINPVVFTNGQQETLAWLITDYVAHLEHHLRQLAAADVQTSA